MDRSTSEYYGNFLRYWQARYKSAKIVCPSWETRFVTSERRRFAVRMRFLKLMVARKRISPVQRQGSYCVKFFIYLYSTWLFWWSYYRMPTTNFTSYFSSFWKIWEFRRRGWRIHCSLCFPGLLSRFSGENRLSGQSGEIWWLQAWCGGAQIPSL